MRRHVSGPFAFPVRDIIGRAGEMREFSLTVPTPTKWGEGLVAVPDGEPLDLDVRLEAVHEGILVTGTADTHYVGVCGRCLTDIVQPVEVEFQELFGYPGDEASDFEIHDDHVDSEPLVRDAIVLSLPFQPVCQPDCPGLDPNTGERLTREAESETRDTTDPRWAALQNFTDDGSASPRAVEKTEES